MAVAEATIAMPNGQVNGYHHGSPFAETIWPQHTEPNAEVPTSQQACAVIPAVAVELKESAQRPQTTAGVTKETGATQKKPAAQKRGTASAEETKQPKSNQSKVKYVPQAELDAEEQKLEALSQAALAGDTSALDQLRAELDSCPHIWRRLGDLRQLVEHKMIELVAGKNPLKAEAFRKRCSALRHEVLEGEFSTLATKLAAGRLIICLMFADFLELQALESPAELSNIKVLEQAERRVNVAMRTFLLAKSSELQRQQLK